MAKPSLDVTADVIEWEVSLDTSLTTLDGEWGLHCLARTHRLPDSATPTSPSEAHLYWRRRGISYQPATNSLQIAAPNGRRVWVPTLSEVRADDLVTQLVIDSMRGGNTLLGQREYDWQVAELASALGEFPTPVFGSPPRDWQPLQDVLMKAGVGATGTALYVEHPVLAVAGGAGLFVYWLVRPAARLARRSLAERIAEKLGVEIRPGDED